MVSYQLLALLSLLLAALAQHPPPKLVYLQEIFRHGARYPEKILGIGDEFAAQEKSMGELTSQGRSMHYLLGKQMYQRYWKALFAGTPYETQYNQSRFYVKSTDVNRTIESVQSHLYGLLEELPALEITQQDLPFSKPPYLGVKASPGPIFGNSGRTFHPMAVHVEDHVMTPFDGGDFLATFMSDDCPNQKKWMSSNTASDKAKAMFANPLYVEALKQLSLSLNLPADTINSGNFYQYYDNLICMQYLGKQVPSLILQPSENKRALDSLYSLNTNVVFYFTDEQTHASASGFFGETIRSIKNSLNNSQAPQWVIYSAHDVTVGQMLAAMKMWNAECIYDSFLKNVTNPDHCITQFPQFATVLVFEVYRHADQQLTLKVNYNGNYRQIPFCDYREECELERFYEWYESWAVKDVKAACGVYYYYQDELKWMAVGAVAHFVLLFLWKTFFSKQVKEQIKSKIN